MNEAQPAGGDIIVYAKVRESEARGQLWHLLENLPGERVTSNIYEVFVEDWEDGLWDREVAKMQEIIDLATDTLIFWRVAEGKMVRTCISGRYT